MITEKGEEFKEKEYQVFCDDCGTGFGAGCGPAMTFNAVDCLIKTLTDTGWAIIKQGEGQQKKILCPRCKK